MRNPFGLWSLTKLALKSVLCMLWAIPWIIVAILFFITVIGWPIGVLLLGIGTWPYYLLHKNRLDAIQRWRNREYALNENDDDEVPWII